MIKLKEREGILLVDIEIIHNEELIKVEDLVVDTGCATTIVDLDIFHKYSLGYDNNTTTSSTISSHGTIDTCISKIIDNIVLGDMSLKNITIDFAEFSVGENSDINGLLGTNILAELGLVVDLKTNTLYKSEKDCEKSLR